jgi:hypothetical protein
MQVSEIAKNLRYIERDREWFALLANISLRGEVEISISVKSKEVDINPYLQSISALVTRYAEITEMLLQKVFKSLHQYSGEKTILDYHDYYFLSAISLKQDNRTWWLVLEPLDVPSIINHFWRFTMVDQEIVWSNVE